MNGIHANGIHRVTQMFPWQESWEESFVTEQALIMNTIAAAGLKGTVYHIGSTSVKGMISKPIIDILLCPEKTAALDTVREWLAEFSLEESEAWFREWQKTIIPLTKRMNEFSAWLSENNLNMVGEGLLNALYAHYSNEQDFMEQFHLNSRKAHEFLDMIEGTLRQFGRIR